MSFVFKDAVRDSAKLLIGLCGPSGSGKTLSALRLATGVGGKIAFIDTEQGRATMYAGDYQFMHGLLTQPFTPDRYKEALEAAIGIKPSVVIIDSVSHEWEGPGGILETVEKTKAERGDNMLAWVKPKAQHQKLVNLLLQTPAHVILCMRAKEKRGLAAGRGGKMEVVDLGWHPITEGRLTYELTINMLLSADRKGVPIVNGFDFGKLPYNMADLLPDGEQISESTGKRLAEWAKGETAKPENGATKSNVMIMLYEADGETVAGEYPSYGEWLTGIEMAAKHNPGVVNGNFGTIVRLAESAKTPTDLRERAERLRERVAGEAEGGDA